MEDLEGEEKRKAASNLQGTLQILTCRTSVLRVTRSTGLYSSAVEKQRQGDKEEAPGHSPCRATWPLQLSLQATNKLGEGQTPLSKAQQHTHGHTERK